MKYVNPFENLAQLDPGEDIFELFENLKRDTHEALPDTKNEAQARKVLRIARHSIGHLQLLARSEGDYGIQGEMKSWIKDLRTYRFDVKGSGGF